MFAKLLRRDEEIPPATTRPQKRRSSENFLALHCFATLATHGFFQPAATVRQFQEGQAASDAVPEAPRLIPLSPSSGSRCASE
jgi:hypothetical protein